MDPFGEIKEDSVYRQIIPRGVIKQGKGILIECKIKHAMKTRKALDNLPHYMGGGFNPEALVPGAKKEDAKAVIHLITEEHSDLRLQALIVRIRQRILPKEVLLAIDDIFNDPTAMVMEFTNPCALGKVWHLCDELASINGNSAMMRTSVNQEVWEEAVENFSRKTQMLPSPE